MSFSKQQGDYAVCVSFLRFRLLSVWDSAIQMAYTPLGTNK